MYYIQNDSFTHSNMPCLVREKLYYVVRKSLREGMYGMSQVITSKIVFMCQP